MSLAGIEPMPQTFTVTWNVQPRFADELVSPGVKDAATETTVTLAQGLPNSSTIWQSPAATQRPLLRSGFISRRSVGSERHS